MEFGRRQTKHGFQVVTRVLASSLSSKAAQEARIAAGAPAPPGIIAKFLGYFVNRKKRFIFFGVFALVLYFAQKKGYTKQLMFYALKKVEERVQAEMEKQQNKLQNSMEKSSAFSKSYKESMERLPTLYSNRMKLLVSQHLGTDKIKEQLRNKSLTAAEKTKSWQALRIAVLQSVVILPVQKAFLTLLYSIRDILISKYNRKLGELVEKHKLKESKFLHNSVESTKSYLTVFFDLFAEKGEQELVSHFRGSTIDVLFPAKVSEKVSIDWFLTRLQETHKYLFCKPHMMSNSSRLNNHHASVAGDSNNKAPGATQEGTQEPAATTVEGLITGAVFGPQPDTCMIERKVMANSSGRSKMIVAAPFSNSGSIKYQLKHKRIAKGNISLSKSFMGALGFIKEIFWSPKQSAYVETRLAETFISTCLMTKYRDYTIDNSDGLIVRQLLHETNRRSCDKLSIIAESDEKHEDHSELIEEPSANAQPEVIYEDMGGWEGKDLDCQRTIIKSLENIVIDFLKEFFDLWTSANPQLVLEFSIEFGFRKLSNRLSLLAQKFPEYKSNELLFMKLITALNNILEEEFINPQSSKNDMGLYEARTKELVRISKQQSSQPISNPSEVELNIKIGEEAKLQALYSKAERELCARIFLDEEFEEIFGSEEENKEGEGKKANPGEEREDIMNLFSRLNGNSQLQLD